ncbi:helix-turn-helix domain-containing protein [Muricauda sp. CAU 1633]|uniref:GlxA family transcriptional regulator n=1 Tax=Allomuricauda sp. CAU 1633 TaxID=2816036 RepID=UPI001A8F3554|nr:helix-turn-helix domain-containing protein [Muricauda sp. CAU 1633]MBO0322636.1 helix-turn-helix domain-containing protein [Muricauda sp. CAU 1633]
MPTKDNLRFFFLVPPEVQLLDITGPAHLFYEAKEYGAKIETIYLGLDDAVEQESVAGISLGNLTPFHKHVLGPDDLLFLPGLDVQILFAENITQTFRSFFEWLQEQHGNGAKICSVCTGAYLLGFAGLLNGKECTTHWKYIEHFQSQFPKAKVLSDRLIIRDGTLYSSAGVSSGIDLSLFLIEELFGPVFASKIAKEVVIYLRRTENDPQLSVFLQYRNHIDTQIHQVQDTLAQNLSTKTTIEELAENVHMSPRNLTRLFKKTIGITIGEYVEKLRVERAVQLLSSGSKVSVTALECGLQSPNQLRSLLKKHTTSLPSNWQH